MAVSKENAGTVLGVATGSIGLFTGMGLGPLAEIRGKEQSPAEVQDMLRAMGIASFGALSLGILASLLTQDPMPLLTSAVIVGSMVLLYREAIFAPSKEARENAPSK